MASKPNPSWTEPQKGKFKAIQEATEVAIPYFGPEIPVLDNHTAEQVCDELGVIKEAKKVFEKVENALKERFKVKLAGRTELRGNKYVATIKGSVRTALDQGKVKEFLQSLDDEGINLKALIDGVMDRSIPVPNSVFFPEDSLDTNTHRFMTDTTVETLNVKEI